MIAENGHKIVVIRHIRLYIKDWKKRPAHAALQSLIITYDFIPLRNQC